MELLGNDKFIWSGNSRWDSILAWTARNAWKEVNGLWGSLFHQNTLYSATPYAIPYVAQAAHRAVPECQRQILEFLKACAEHEHQFIIPSPLFSAIRIIKGIRRYTISSALLSCHETIKRFLSDKQLAIWLDDYCRRHGGQPTASTNGGPTGKERESPRRHPDK
jgi:hypothetical protein